MWTFTAYKTNGFHFLEVSLLNSVCHSNMKLTVAWETTTVCDNLLKPPQARYCVQQPRFMHWFSNFYACFFQQEHRGLGPSFWLQRQQGLQLPVIKTQSAFYVSYSLGALYLSVALMGWEHREGSTLLLWMFRTALFLGVIKIN